MSKSTAPVGIDVDSQETDVVRFAEEELRTHLKKVLGAAAVRAGGRVGREKLVIRLGRSAEHVLARRRPALLKKLRGLADETFAIEPMDGEVLILGRDDAGTLHAAHQFIEEHLGVRWYFPDETIAPRMSAGKFLASVRRSRRCIEAPTFSCRSFEVSNTIEWLNWTSRNRFNAVQFGQMYPASPQWACVQRLAPEIHRRGLQISVSGHQMMSFLPSKEYFRKHPEWFALIAGKRDDRRRQLFCTSSKPAMKMFLENLRAYVEATPEIDRFDLWPEDGCRCCECPKCARTPIADRHVRLVNEMARVVHSVRPDAPFSLLAYGTFRPAPVKAKLDRSVQVHFCWWGRNYAIPFNHDDCAIHNDRVYNDAGHRACWHQLGEFKKWARTCGKTNGLVIYDQHMAQAIRGPNLLPIPHLTEDYKWFESVGVVGVSHGIKDGNQWICGLNAYAVGKMLWNRTRRREEILDDFFRNYYERAAGPMRALYEAIDRGFPHLRRTYHATLRKARNFNMYATWSRKPQRRYPSDLKEYNRDALASLDECDRLLAQARKRADSRALRARLQKIAVHLKYLRCSRESIDRQMTAKDLVEEAMDQDAKTAAATLGRAARTYREALGIERVLMKILRDHKGEGVIWDSGAWSRRVWNGAPRVSHFPMGISTFWGPDGKNPRANEEPKDVI